MKNLIAAILLLSLQVWASDQTPVEKLRDKIRLSVNSFIVSEDGKEMLLMDSGLQEYRPQTKDGLIKGTWSSSLKEFPTPYLEFSLQVTENRTLKWKLDEHEGSNENKKLWERTKKGKLMNS